jgi:Fe2+ transport system protein FeoA
VVEASSIRKRPQTWRTRVVHSNETALSCGGSLRARLFSLGVVAGGRLRVPVGGAVGVKPAADPVKRILVNAGSAPRAPGCWWRPGKARCRLMGAGRGGVRVVVRAGERPVHGEGGQQDRSNRSRSGGRA